MLTISSKITYFDLKNKFVLVDNEIIARRAVFHKEIHKSPLGGGWWYYHREQNKLILYGSSHDFGSVTKEQVEKAKLGGFFRNLKDVEVILDERDHLEVMQILIDNFGLKEGVECCTKCDFI